MAGTSYFGNRSTSSGESPFHKLKNIPLTNKTLVESSGTNSAVYIKGIPVYRSAAANYRFIISSSSIVLRLDQVSGSPSTITTVDPTTYLATSVVVAVHLNSTDQCLYVLVKSGTSFRALKIADTSGTVTTLGSSFIPATGVNWPSNLSDSASVEIDGSGHLRISINGSYHQLNKTTGAIVSQDNSYTIGSYSLLDTDYISVDGTIAASKFSGQGIETGSSALWFPRLVSSTAGIIAGKAIPISYVFSGFSDTIDNNSFVNRILVDSDKVFIGDIGGATDAFGYFNRADYDQFLLSVSDWYVGS